MIIRKEFMGLVYGLLGLALFALGVVVNVFFSKLFGMALVAFGFGACLYGFVRHALAFLERRKKP